MKVFRIAFSLTLFAAPLAAQTPEEQVVAVVKRSFDAMRAKDTVAYRSALAPDARLVGTGTNQQGQPTYRVVGMGNFVSSIGRSTNRLDERIFEPEVRIDQNLATVWTRYEFWVDQNFSHCGYDAFQLIKTRGEWKIAQIADTQRRVPEQCGRGTPPVKLPEPTRADTAAIIAALQSVFDGMKTKDTVALRQVFVPEGQLIGIQNETSDWHPLRADAWATQLAQSQRPGELIERMQNPEVRISDNLATVWTWYDFHIGTRFSHCGIDAAQLAKTASGWKVVQITYTVRQSPCDRPGRN
jgi:hypothetical protein